MFTSVNPITELNGPFGIPVQIAPSILLLVLIFVGVPGNAQDLAYDLMYLGIVVGSIFLHEVGHAWGCHIQNVPVRRIVLNGCGGFCEPSRSATRYENELIVAMGPIVNLVLWAVFSLLAPLVTDPEMGWVVQTIAWVNIWLACLNLIPVVPLDGSKLFYLGLCRLMRPGIAAGVCGVIGMLFASLLILLLVSIAVEDPVFALDWWFLLAMLILVPALPAHWRMLRSQSA